MNMGVIVKKCLACGTINQYIAKSCKSCESPLLAEVDQDDEIMSIDPMEAAVNDAVSTVEIGDDMVVKILREQAEAAKKIVAQENAKEEKKKQRKNASKQPVEFGGGPNAVKGAGTFGFSIGEDKDEEDSKKFRNIPRGTTYGGLDGTEGKASETFGFKIRSDDGPVKGEPRGRIDESSATWSREVNRAKDLKKSKEQENSKWKIKGQ